MNNILSIILSVVEFAVSQVITFFKNFAVNLKKAGRYYVKRIKFVFKNIFPVIKAFKNKWVVVWGGFCVLLVCAFAVLMNVTVNYYFVSYNGVGIGYTRNFTIANAAVGELQNAFSGSEKVLNDLKNINIVQVKSSNWFLSCMDKEKLESSIVSASDTISSACGLYVDGTLSLVVNSQKNAESAISDFKADRIALSQDIVEQYDSCEVVFDKEITVKTGYYTSESLCSTASYDAIYSFLEQKIGYIINAVQTVTETVPYITYYERTEDLLPGQKKTLRSGVNGQKQVQYQVTVQNGELVSEKVLSETVTKKAIACKKQIGNGTIRGQDSHTSLILPVEGYVSSGFGDRSDPFTGQPANHNGLDIAAKTGTPIYAAAGGKVIQASDKKNGFGNCVVIEHSSGYRTLYGHCSKLLVSVGDYVAQGDEIALVGSTGRSTGPHLHFSIIVDGKYIDPSVYF